MGFCIFCCLACWRAGFPSAIEQIKHWRRAQRTPPHSARDGFAAGDAAPRGVPRRPAGGRRGAARGQGGRNLLQVKARQAGTRAGPHTPVPPAPNTPQAAPYMRGGQRSGRAHARATPGVPSARGQLLTCALPPFLFRRSASWCGPCRRFTPALRLWYDMLKVRRAAQSRWERRRRGAPRASAVRLTRLPRRSPRSPARLWTLAAPAWRHAGARRRANPWRLCS